MKYPVIEVEDLRKEFPGRRGAEPMVAVAGATFRVEAGESLAIVGESGSGKSTLARMITGLETPTSGSILVDGEVVSHRRSTLKERRRRGGILQMVFQDPYQSLDRRQKIGACLEESLALHTDLDRQGRAERIAELLEQVGLGAAYAERLPRVLSGGQRQRVAIARALATQPRMLVLDEAVAALDVSIQAQILNLLLDIREQTSVALLFISHDLGVVREVCDDVVVMRRGEIVERGNTAIVLDNPTADYTRRLVDSVPRPGWKPRRSVITAAG